MMEELGQQGQDRVAVAAASSTSTTTVAAVERHLPDNLTEQPFPPKNEKIVSTSSVGAANIGPPRIVTDQPEALVSSGALAVYPPNTSAPPEQTFFYGASGYDNNISNWGDYSNYVNSNNLQIVTPTMYNDNPSLYFPSGYGFDTQVAYGQFSPLASPLSPIMFDGQMYSPHQIPNYYAQPMSSIPHVTSSHSMSQTEMITPGSRGQDSSNDNIYFGPGSGYYMHFGSFAGGNPSGNSNPGGFYNYPGEFGSAGEMLSNRSNPSDTGNILSPLTPGAVYSQPIGLLGSYEHNFGQASQQQTPFTRRYPNTSSYRSSSYGNWDAASRFNPLTPDKSGRRERDRDSVSISTDSHGIPSDRNRGPRASKPKGKNGTEETTSPGIGKAGGASTSGINLDLYNRLDFVTDYEKAKFFVIKSFSEDNVHKSIKYSVWASTPLGNRKLDAAYQEVKETKDNCPVFLFFSVNASGQFCGVAEMTGSVDFENDANYWQQDRWSGQFAVKWHIIKDVPNGRLRHILLENNDNKPVTHSRDSQEVKLEQGLEMLKIFKEHDADTSLLDDFMFYDERERSLLEKKARQQRGPGKPEVSDASINQLSENLANTLHLKVSEDKTK